MKILEQMLSEFDFTKDVSRAKDVISWSWDKGKETFLPDPRRAAYIVAFLFTPMTYAFGKGALRGGSVGAAVGAVIAYALGNDVAAGAGAGAQYGIVADVGQQTIRGLVSAIREGRTLSQLHEKEIRDELSNNKIYQAYLVAKAGEKRPQ